jgi:cyanophycin synthetase
MYSRNIKISYEDLDRFDFTARELMREALDRGWAVEYSQALPDDSISGVSECRKGRRRIVFRTDHTVLAPIFGYLASENKHLTTALFEKNQIPTPDSVTLPIDASDEQLGQVLSEFQTVVVKPLNTNHGNGVTVGADSILTMKTAVENVKKAAPKGKFMLLQKQVFGAEEYRFLVLEGEVIAVARRYPPFVVGDGTKNTRDLIDELNADPRRGDGHKAVMTKIKLSEVICTNGPEFLEMVPAKDERVELLKTSNLSRGGVAEDFTEVASQAVKQIAVAAAKSCFLGLAGVDIMTSDIAGANRSNSFVIEVNSAPGLRMHEHPSIGRPRPVVSQIFDALAKRATLIEEGV